MQRDAQGAPPPFGEPALFTTLLLEPGFEQPALQVTPAARAPFGEQFLDRYQRAARLESPRANGLLPGRSRAPEPGATLSRGQPAVMGGLDCWPAKAARGTRIGRAPELAGMVGDGG